MADKKHSDIQAWSEKAAKKELTELAAKIRHNDNLYYVEVGQLRIRYTWIRQNHSS